MKNANKTPDPIDIHVGNRIRIQRNLMNMSQQDLANKIGVKFQQVQKYEKAMNRVSASRLYMIADVFQIPVAYFFNEFDPSAEKEKHRDELLTKDALEIVAVYSKIPAKKRALALNMLKAVA